MTKFEFVTNNNAAVVEEYEEAAFKTKEQHMADYIKSMKALEDAMEPYKEQKRDLRKEYDERFANPYIAASLGYIDDIIDPSETRSRIIGALSMLKNKRESLPPKKHGSIPL